jgi:VCBS repeat-containing protein
MKKNLMVQFAGVVCLLAGLTWGGTVAVTPAAKTYLQTELTVGTPVSLRITLNGWGDTNLTVSAAGGGSIFGNVSVEPAGGTQETDRVLFLTPRGVAGSTTVTVTATGGGSASNTVSLTVTPVPVVTGLPATVSFNEDTTLTNAFVVEYWGSATGLTFNALIDTSPALIQSATISGNGTNQTLTLKPYENAYGSTTVRVVTADSVFAKTNSILVRVLPVADGITVSDWPTAPIRLNVGGMPTNRVFSAVTITDPDHLAYKNGTSNEYLKASADVNNVSIHFSDSQGSATTSLTTGSTPLNVTTWVRSLSLYPPESSYAPIGQVITNTLTLIVYGDGHNDMLSVTKTVPVLLLNPNHPPQYIPSVSPSSLREGQTISPFSLSQLFDQDAIHTTFSLRLFVKPEHAALATVNSTATLYGNESDLNSQLNTIGFTAVNGGISTVTTNVTVYYVLSDSIDYVTNSVTLTINAITTAPVINGIDELSSYYSINDTETLCPFPTVIPYDTDQGGQQRLSASFSVSDPTLGGFTYQEDPVLNFSLRSQADLQAALRQLKFVPIVGALPIGTSAEVRLTLTVTDSTGLSTVNSSTRIQITAVNQPPSIKVPQEQPVLLPPNGDLRPFAGTTVTNDDLNSVTLTITLDNNAKGTLGNLGGFAYASGTYTMSGSIGAINASLTNLTYAVNPQHLFPSDDPGGTVFTLEAEDYQIKLGRAQVWVQIQDAPRNHLVTKTANDGTPGSLLFALAHAANNDVITFALPQYPAVIRVPEAFGPLVLSTSLTLKGPGADLLTISGDSDGDGDADGQIFVVQSRVTIEGLTLSQGYATLGGAVSVTETGTLTLRSCAVTDCKADEYGGAIDVEGALRLENCYLARNRVSETGGGGGAVSFYTSHDSAMVNTTFASNRIDNASGAGGGAVNVERADGTIALVNVAVTHCTFAGNADASGRASAVYVVGGNTLATLKNNIFSDYSVLDGARNIDVTGNGDISSEGGNVCDDSTRTMFQQGGGTSVFLLTHTGDRTEVMPGLGALTQAKGDTTPSFPLQDLSPALRLAQASEATTDQRGRIRRSQPGDSGAIQQDADERVVITEIQLSAEAGDTDQFIEVFVPRDGQDVDLNGFKLFVNGVAVHEFGQGVLVLTNNVHTTFAPASGIPASYLLAPGRGVVIAFPKGETADFTGFASLNPTPVVRASIVTNAAELALLLSSYGRGSVALAKSETAVPIVLQTFLTVFNDPDAESGTNRLDTAHNSIVPAPQSRGYAFIPHSSVSALIYGGWKGLPSVTPSGVLLQSPGATVDGTPFGLNNAFPQAASDVVSLSEDDVGTFDVLGNDLDADGNDRLVIVDVSTASQPATGEAATASSQLGATVTMTPASVPLQGSAFSYDPRGSAALQALPVGVEVLDTFYYEIIDIGSAAVDAIAAGTPSNTWVTAMNHRLNTGDSVVLFGVSAAAYNGEFEVTVLDENTFAIPVPFGSVAEEPGVWETVNPRTPSERSEASVTIRVTGVNDAPTVGRDVVTNVTEASTVRIMVRPEFANMPLSLPSDPVPPPTPNPAHLLDNDTDVDTDETWQTLRLIGIMASVHAIDSYSGTPGEAPLTVHAPSHGLASGTEILIANYGGHPSYNGYHAVTVLDADTFTLPIFYVDNEAAKGVWVVLDESNRYNVVTDKGATVALTLRADPREDNMIYDASTSAFLNTLAQGELYTNRFYQAVVDRHGAIGIGPIDIVVVGLNDTPVARPDPEGLSILNPLLTPSNTLEQVLSSGLDILYTLPPASSTPGRIDVQALDLSGTLPGTLVLPNLWSTDEDTLIALHTISLLSNDSDIDTIDVLEVTAVATTSREGAALALVGGEIRYNPAASAALQALAREERVIDTFSITVSDRMTGGTVTSLVSVLVIGLNDTPVARPDALTLSEDERVSFNPITHPTATPALHDSDLDMNGTLPDDLLTVLVVSNLLTVGEARVDLETLLATYDATVSERLNQLADWQEYSDSFNYTISDNSFLFVMDDSFYVPAETVGRSLDVLANDRDFTPFASTLTIVDVGPALMGGTVSIAPDGKSLVYDSPAGPACDDYFRYVVENEVGNRRSARVLVRSVTPPLNGILGAASDHAAVAYGETAVLNVRANDNTLPLSGAELSLLTNIWDSSVSGQPVPSGNVFLFTATNGMTPLTFTYGVTAGGTSVAQADVRVDVIDRRGTLYVKNDTFSVHPASVSNALEVLSNDSLVTGSTDALRIATLIDPALFGTAVVDVAARRLVYTPNEGFIGVENLRYLATDTIGGTGTGVVSIIVGKIDTVIDFFTVEAKTNDLGITLDVLANDRVQPFGTNALTLVSVTPGNTAIGTLSVGGSGKQLLFMPSNTVGQADFVYVVSDSTARMATGTVSIATVPSGSYANTDRFVVRGGGSAYTLDVLANDRSYPEAGKSYTLVSIGTGAEAPSAGGTVSVVSNRLSYTPVPGFIGQESFTYTMSDAVATDSAWVTVTVTPGDLFANADAFDVFYARESGATSARAFTLPVTFNDRIQPALGQSVQITGLGVGPNAPDHAGRVTISSDGLSLVYEPTDVPSPAYVERFTYEISDGAERRASGQVEVRVLNRVNTLGALVQDDAFTVLRSSVNNTLPLLSNDFAQPGTAAGWVITTNSATAYNGTVSISGANVLYTPPEGFVGIDTFTYSVNDGLGGTGSATVRVKVGALPTLPDLFVALSGSQSNDFDVVANDVLFDTYAGEYTLADVFGTTQGGTVTLSPSNTVSYAPATAYAGLYPYTETFFYTVHDDASGIVTGVVDVVVHEQGSDQSTTTVSMRVLGRNDIPVIVNNPPNPTITDKETSHPFTGVTLIEVDQQTLEPLDVTVSLDDAAKGVLRELGSFVDLGNGRYGLVGATAAAATTNLHNLLFVPTENRITVPQTEPVRFTLVVTDNKSAPLTDTQTVVRVTAVNDAPVIAGTRAGQTVYAAMPIRLFSSVTITEVDDLTIQPLAVTVQLSNAANGVLQNLGSFVSLGGGAYRATGLSAAQATQQLRALEFLYGAGLVTANQPQLTVFTLTIEDAFAPPVTDNQTSVWAYSPAESALLPTESVLRSTFGFSVDICQNFAVGGAPGANANGTDSGSAVVYRLVTGTTNTWEQWRQLQPPGVEANDQFGYAVSISENLIAVGAIDDEVGTSEVGVVYLFGRDVGGTDNWGLLRRLAPTNLPTGSRFGMSVDVTGDLLAVGAPRATLSGSSPAEGAVLLFGRNVSGPDAWGEIMRWEPRAQTSIECGWSVALDSDRLVTGAPRNKTGTPVSSPKGAVFCFGRDVGGVGAWGLSQTIRLGAVTNVDNFGYSVSMKGTLLAVGAPTAQVPGGAISAAGVVYLFAPGAGGAWAQAAVLDAKADGEVRFGQSVSLSSDLLLVGAPGSWATAVRGSAYLYRRTSTNGSGWLLTERLMNPQPETSAHFASAVSLCQTVAIVGAVDGIFDRYTPNDTAYMYRFKFNNAPVVVTPLADQMAEWGEPFAYTIPDGVFEDPDVYDVLTVVSVLPTAGHGLTVAGMNLSGTPTVLGRVPVEVTATDASAASTMESFDVVVLVDGILLANTPRNLWNLEYFGKDAANPALEATLWGGAANMDGDTKDNDQEYAFGGDPKVSDSSALLTLSPAPGGNLLLTYVRRKNDPALSYTLQGSPTLAPPVWDDVVAVTVREQFISLGTSYERVEVTISTPLAGPSMFFRVLVTP